MTTSTEPRSLANQVAQLLQQQLLSGYLRPGDHLSEAALASHFSVSRNTLREAFRLLTQRDLLVYLPNRGVFVNTPTRESILDIYHVRSTLECAALRKARLDHPAIAAMEEATLHTRELTEQGRWQEVCTANMQFHSAVIAFSDSPRIQAWFAHLLVEQRLVFSMLPTCEAFISTFVEKNQTIVDAVKANRIAEAAEKMASFLIDSQQDFLRIYDTHTAQTNSGRRYIQPN